jgi:hypothetical protein
MCCSRELRYRGQWHRGRADEVEVELIEPLGLFGIDQCTVEALDYPCWAELARVVLDIGPAAARAGLAAIYPSTLISSRSIASDRTLLP